MLKVNSVFGPTIQGEGPTQGKQVMFIRLAFCNLSCTWCDTKYTWDWKNYDRAKEVHDMDYQEVLEKLTSCKSLVISGGEPTIQQKALIPLLIELRKQDYWVEVESNGTIVPQVEFLELVSQINCSPKLSNSGDSREKRIKPVALATLVASPKVFFKFVIGTKTDIEEVWEYVKDYSIQPNRVYLMPLGKTKDELVETTWMTKELARQHGFVFSSRLHVELWGTKRDV